MIRQPASSAARLGLAAGLAAIVALVIAVFCLLLVQQARRSRIAADALERIDRRGQEIVNAAFPGRIGAAPFQGATVEEVRRRGDGYLALVTLRYTNILDDKNHMQIELAYDRAGSFTAARIRKCNDRWASPAKLVSLATDRIMQPRADTGPSL